MVTANRGGWFTQGSNAKPHTGDGKTNRDIQGGKENTDRSKHGDLKIEYRTADGKIVKK